MTTPMQFQELVAPVARCARGRALILYLLPDGKIEWT
jgi:hypothetical protein